MLPQQVIAYSLDKQLIVTHRLHDSSPATLPPLVSNSSTPPPFPFWSFMSHSFLFLHLFLCLLLKGVWMLDNPFIRRTGHCPLVPPPSMFMIMVMPSAASTKFVPRENTLQLIFCNLSELEYQMYDLQSAVPLPKGLPSLHKSSSWCCIYLTSKHRHSSPLLLLNVTKF